MRRLILNKEDILFKIGNETVKVKRCIWVLVEDENTRNYKTDAIRCSYIGAGFSTVGAFYCGRKKLVSISKKDPLKSIEKLIDLELLFKRSLQGLGTKYIAKKHTGFHIGTVVYTSNGDRHGLIDLPELGINHHYFECNSTGPKLERDETVEVYIDADSYLLDHCGVCKVQSWKYLVEKNNKAVGGAS